MGLVLPFASKNDKQDDIKSIDPLLQLTAEDMARVNEAILARAHSDVDMIPDLALYLIDSGGKRLRPMLTVAAAQMCGYRGDNHIKLAASVEFMHTATLLHDDVVDESELRRGRRAPRMVWSNQASVLVGDYLLGQAFKMMVETRSLEALRILSNAAAVIAEGEVLQLSAQKDISTTEDAYLRIIDAKTAALFSAAGEVGAAIANRGRAEVQALQSFGRNLGLAFQLIDDALDYSGKQALLGKSVGDDFREGKITLPVILAFRRGDGQERAFWQRSIEQGEMSDEDLSTAIALVEKHGAIADTVERARHYGAIAREALALFDDSAHKTALLGAVDFCIDRAF